MTAWGWAASAPAPSTADLESAPRLPPMAVAVAGAAEEEVLALAPVRPASAAAGEVVVVVAEEVAAVVAAAGAAVDWAKTRVGGDAADAADAVHSTDNSPVSETGGALRLRCPDRYRARRATPR